MNVSYKCFPYRNKMLKNWGVIGGIAAAIAAGVYVLWGPITERKKRKRGKTSGMLFAGDMWATDCKKMTLQWYVFFFRYGSRSLELGQHVLPQLFASGFSSMSVLHWVAGKVFTFAHDPVVQRQPTFHHTASASQRWNQSVLQSVVDVQSFCRFLI